MAPIGYPASRSKCRNAWKPALSPISRRSVDGSIFAQWIHRSEWATRNDFVWRSSSSEQPERCKQSRVTSRERGYSMKSIIIAVGLLPAALACCGDAGTEGTEGVDSDPLGVTASEMVSNTNACSDDDCDDVCDDCDNCPDDYNPWQKDSDGDGVGNACDNCPDDHNPWQKDSDKDGIGDACDSCTDTDCDGVCDCDDNCPNDHNPGQKDADKDGKGDACDSCTDVDCDGVCDCDDNCPNDHNPGQKDADKDGIGDACDPCTDVDRDDVCDCDDFCPGTKMPESVPYQTLLPNHYALTNGDKKFDTKSPNGQGAQRDYTTEDTGGCSCKQILDRMQGGNGQYEHGCSVGTMGDWVDYVDSH
jgi:hypothetical protein